MICPRSGNPSCDWWEAKPWLNVSHKNKTLKKGKIDTTCTRDLLFFPTAFLGMENESL